MKLSIFPTELKILVRCINALSKLGQEIYFDWADDALVLKTVNSSRSAYAAVTFKRIFFEKFDSSAMTLPFRFKIPSRSCCSVFKLSASLEKAIQKCRILISADGNLLVVQFFCKHAIVKTFNMSIIDCEYLEAIYSLEQSANHLVLPTKILGEVLGNFRQTTEELTLILKEGECTFQNHIPHGESAGILTQLPLCASEFDSYLVTCESELTFCQKELRALYSFCELVSPLLRIYCDRPGHPVIFACTHETRLTARFVLATLPADAFTTSSSSQRSQTLQPHLLASKTPVQLRRPSDYQDSISISMVSHSILPEFPTSTSIINAAKSAPSNTSAQLTANMGGQVNHTQLVPISSSPAPSPPSRPFSVPRIRQALNPTIVAPTTSTAPSVGVPPVKKARSMLFSRLEQSDGSDSENQSIEAMDLELHQLTKRYGDSDWRPCGLTSNNSRFNTTPSRTVLVADSDEEDC